jgi:hypothetical protein
VTGQSLPEQSNSPGLVFTVKIDAGRTTILWDSFIVWDGTTISEEQRRHAILWALDFIEGRHAGKAGYRI